MMRCRPIARQRISAEVHGAASEALLHRSVSQAVRNVIDLLHFPIAWQVPLCVLGVGRGCLCGSI